MTVDTATNETIELMQVMIRNACVNDGRAESGHEVRSSDTLHAYLEGSGLDLEVYDPTPGRRSLVTRITGSDPAAPTLLPHGSHRRRARVSRRMEPRPVRRRVWSTARCGAAAPSTC